MPVSEVDIETFAEQLAAGARVIDVREPDEYGAGHVPGVVSIPLATVPDHLDEFTRDAATYIICRSGARSMRAAEIASGEGLDVVNVAGGTLAWIESGRDVVVGSAAS